MVFQSSGKMVRFFLKKKTHLILSPRKNLLNLFNILFILCRRREEKLRNQRRPNDQPPPPPHPQQPPTPSSPPRAPAALNGNSFHSSVYPIHHATHPNSSDHYRYTHKTVIEIFPLICISSTFQTN